MNKSKKALITEGQGMYRSKKVLIVDDTSNVRETIKVILSDLECQFLEASSGKQALSISKKKVIDVIILDYGLPADGLNGIQTLERARQLNMRLPPVIILTGFLESSIEKKARELGVFEFLTKDPLPDERLKDAVLRALGTAGQP